MKPQETRTKEELLKEMKNTIDLLQHLYNQLTIDSVEDKYIIRFGINNAADVLKIYIKELNQLK